MKAELPDEGATWDLAAAFAEHLPSRVDGWTIVLKGELGAGKSTFARSLLRALGHQGAVPSPTYTLVEPYETAKGRIYHVDLYRISSADELAFLGFDELDDGLRLVEWPERVAGLEARADVQIELGYQGEGRSAVIRGRSARGRRLVAGLAAAWAETID